MKKILLVSNSLWNINNFRKNLLIKLLDLNYKVDIIVPNNDLKNEFLSHKNLNIYFYNFKAKSFINFNDLIFLLKLFRYFKKNKPNFVFSFTVKPNLACAFFSKYFDYRIICNVTGLGTLFLRGFLIKRIAFFLYKISFKNVYHVFFHNLKDRDIFIENSIVHKLSCSIIPGSGVDLKKFKFHKKNYNNNLPINFLYVGRIMKEKGIYEYLDSIKSIKSRIRNVNFIFAGKKNLNDKKLIKLFDYFISKKIIIYLSEVVDVKNILEDCDCLVLPSYREGLSKSLLEAAAVGRPLIVSDVPGCNDIVTNNLNGLIFKPYNPKSLEMTLIKFINLSSQDKSIMALHSYKKSSMYDENIVIKSYLNLL